MFRYHSNNGFAPGCKVCAKGTYTDVTQKQCLACGPRTSTHAEGATSSADCKEPICPAHSQDDDPDANGDCACLSGSACDGGGDKCRKDAAQDIWFFDVSCSACYCTEQKKPPTIDFVFTPTSGWKKGRYHFAGGYCP